MIYKNIINKSYLNKNVSFDFSLNGLYVFKGPNGCGKTTIIEEILFDRDETHYKFHDAETEKMFHSARFNVFSYVPQKILYSELKVSDYINKLNILNSDEKILYYLELFGMNKAILDNKFCYLSGGEQMKISIISALVKDTPYLFMDEPTNYLDDNSVTALKGIISEEAKKRRIILVTHDPRLIFENASSIDTDVDMPRFEGDSLQDGSERQIFDYSEKKTKYPKLWKILTAFGKKFSFLVSVYVFIIFLAMMMTLSNMDFENSVSNEEMNESGDILVYRVGGYHDEVNENYEYGEGLNVDPGNYDILVVYEDISKISDLNGVEKIYVCDEVYCDQLLLSFYDEDYSGIRLYSCPEDLYNHYLENVDYFGLSETEGSLPRDNSFEVAISKKVLISNYGYTSENVSGAIGDEIDISGVNYTIVGFTAADLAVVSYNEGEDYGYYCYDEETYNDFVSNYYDYYSELEEYYITHSVSNMLICVDGSCERTVLNYMMVNYPADCYNCLYYATVSRRAQIKKVFLRYLWIDLAVSLVFGVVVFIMIRKSVRLNMYTLKDFGNYYMNRPKIIKKYIALQCLIYLFVGILLSVFDIIYFDYGKITWTYIAINFLFAVVGTFIACMLEYNKMKKN